MQATKRQFYRVHGILSPMSQTIEGQVPKHFDAVNRLAFKRTGSREDYNHGNNICRLL